MPLIIKCCICNKTQGDFVEVKQKGILSIVKANQILGDNKFENVSGTLMVQWYI